ncbi:MAG: hypothetical protein Q8M69_02965, partial [Reyranella sp.]|nr:hypothetical protein [Reyranella sp.]
MIKRSMSADVLFQPRLIRIAQPASAAGTPIASRTGDRCTFPDEQAAPALMQTPARSNAMTCVSAGTPGIEMHVVLAILGVFT